MPVKLFLLQTAFFCLFTKSCTYGNISASQKSILEMLFPQQECLSESSDSPASRYRVVSASERQVMCAAPGCVAPRKRAAENHLSSDTRWGKGRLVFFGGRRKTQSPLGLPPLWGAVHASRRTADLRRAKHFHSRFPSYHGANILLVLEVLFL